MALTGGDVLKPVFDAGGRREEAGSTWLESGSGGGVGEGRDAFVPGCPRSGAPGLQRKSPVSLASRQPSVPSYPSYDCAHGALVCFVPL